MSKRAKQMRLTLRRFLVDRALDGGPSLPREIACKVIEIPEPDMEAQPEREREELKA